MAKFQKGVNEAKEDKAPPSFIPKKSSHVEEEAEGEQPKADKRRNRRHGGEIHGSNCTCAKCMGGAAKARGGGTKRVDVGKIPGLKAHHPDRMPRASGGSALSAHSASHPFAGTARSGTQPPGHKASGNKE